jgi:peptidyl-Lys metalloendopeptidase
MRGICLGFVLAVAGLPTLTPAAQFQRCGKAEISFATDALVEARILAMTAAAAAGDTPDFAHWFGPYSPSRGETLRAGLKAIDRALRDPELTLVCPAPGEDGCSFGTYANVFPDRPYVINLCASFFGQPTMAGVRTASAAFDSGTREGTLIHEVSHFLVVAGTDDHCYGREVCAEMSKTAPDLALRNADSFQYFAEDVVLRREGRLD